jgi:GDP-4-dehydro-6-deoxy-D-mannose reductase
MADRVTLVTGAAGFAGWHLVEHLDSRPSLVGWRRPGGRSADSAPRLTWQAVDLTDPVSVKRAFEDVRPVQIFHLAGAPNVATSWEHAADHLRINALGTHHLLEAVRRASHPCRILIVSSGQIYEASEGPIDEDAPLCPSNPYGLSKLAQDQLARRAAADEGLDVVVARPFNHIGPRQQPGYAVASFARQIARIELGLAPPELHVGNLEARRDITDVRDVVRAYSCIMDGAPAGRAYNVCSGRAWRMGDVLDELLRLSPADIRVEIDRSRLRPRDASTVRGDASRIRSELGWIPVIPVEHTLRDTLSWWRAETAAGR